MESLGTKMVIAHNMAAMNAQRQFNITTGMRAKASEKLSSGYRINRSSDDAAGLTISEKMRWQIRGLNRGQNNIMEGISWTQVGDGAMNEVADMLHRMTELCVQAANDTNTVEDRAAIQAEINEIRKEINRIGDTTEFNTQQVFQNEDVMMDIDGAAGNLNIFDSSYDAATDTVEYGGFIIDGTRVKWSDVDANMVTTDPTTHEQIFKGGEYTCTVNGKNYSISCEDGAKVPELSRVITVEASNAGVTVDGKLYQWSDVKDEEGNPATNGNMHSGVWTLDYNDATIAFYMPREADSLNEFIDAINSCSNSAYTYKLKETYVGPEKEQAVDADVENGLRITNVMAPTINGNSVEYYIGADNTGIWIQDENKQEISGSKKTWADLGILAWDEGSYINSGVDYTYADAVTGITFDFTLSDVTSVDSVIDGLHDAKISGNNIVTNYEIKGETTDANILRLDVNYNKGLNFEEEKQLGRDFDAQTTTVVDDAAATYTASTGQIEMDLKDTSNNDVLTYTGTDTTSKNQMAQDIEKYLDYVLDLKKTAALANKSQDLVDIGTVNLTDVVGANNVTTSGHFDDTVVITNTMVGTDGSPSYRPGTVGAEYPAAYIDFKDLGTVYSLDNLRNSGFNSTCKTCSNHYSIVFTDVDGGKTTPEGYEYNLIKDPNGQHYTLEIDIDSIKTKFADPTNPVNAADYGEEFAKALVSINTEAFDFHYTQYAAEGSKLYIYDNRAQSTGTTAATFDTFPFEPLDIGEYKFNLKTADGRKIDLAYTYNFKDIAANAKWTAVRDNSNTTGQYVQLQDGSYAKYDSTQHAGMDRWDFVETYTMKDANGVDVTVTRDELIENYSEDAIAKMFSTTKIDFNAKDYTKVNVNGDELPNVAIRSLFEVDVDAPEYEKGINIQCSSNTEDSVKIPRFPLHTVSLRLYRVNAMDHERASESLNVLSKALNKLSSNRSIYGAYQNRLDHTYASRANMEENTQAAESRIRDTDMASGMLELMKQNILAQAGEAMMANANTSREGILQLLQ